jgi:nicotinamidase-related amidase
MNAQHIAASVDQLVELAQAGNWEVAFEKFYHPDVEKTDLDGIPVKGWEQNLANGRIFSSRISNVRDFSCVGSLVKGNRSFVVWSFDFDVDNSPFRVVEVAVQDWENGKIVKERFFA